MPEADRQFPVDYLAWITIFKIKFCDVVDEIHCVSKGIKDTVSYLGITETLTVT